MQPQEAISLPVSDKMGHAESTGRHILLARIVHFSALQHITGLLTQPEDMVGPTIGFRKSLHVCLCLYHYVHNNPHHG